MKTYLKEVVNIHQTALDLTYTESSILYDILLDFTDAFQMIDENTNDIYISEDIFFQIYAIPFLCIYNYNNTIQCTFCQVANWSRKNTKIFLPLSRAAEKENHSA